MLKDTHHIIEIPEREITKYIPKELAFCNADEFVTMSGLLLQWQTKVIDYIELRVQAVYYFLNLKRGKRTINDMELEIMNSNLYQVSECIDSFFEKTDSGDLQIKLDIISNPLPNIKPTANVWHGPEDRFVNTTFGQYIDAVNVFHLYHRSNDIKHLNMLMAIYYLPINKPYNPDKNKNRASLIKRFVDPNKVQAFFLYFSSFQKYITSSKVIWEGKVIDMSILFTSANDDFESSIPGLGVKSLAFAISESNIIGDIKDVHNEKLWEILLLLYDMRKKDQDAKAREAAAKTNQE